MPRSADRASSKAACRSPSATVRERERLTQGRVGWPGRAAWFMWAPSDSHVHSASFRMAREGMLDPGEKPPGGADPGTRSLRSGRRGLRRPCEPHGQSSRWPCSAPHRLFAAHMTAWRARFRAPKSSGMCEKPCRVACSLCVSEWTSNTSGQEIGVQTQGSRQEWVSVQAINHVVSITCSHL